MRTNCPFLEPLHQPPRGEIFGCGAGVNFYSVGEGQAYCRACSIASLGSLPDCQQLDAYAWLVSRADSIPFVEVELRCALAVEPLPDLRRCAGCRQRLAQPSGFHWPAIASAMAG